MPHPKKPADPNRQLMIKAKTCQRLRKEVEYYTKELKDNEDQLQGMKDGNRDPYDIKYFEEVVGESRMIIPDSNRRLGAAVQDLANLMESAAESSEPEVQLTDEEWIATAKNILEQEKEFVTQEEAALSTNVDDLADDEAF
eukprot:CAMPEP_0198151436 /NCGR_PEP_ID=MMETSP1443-20131203/55546_1 /TAXON_ID=186043 /ORGANISM="Entomoneis sp., Strain CCMP2396" /LENGTH=140 /DNA_ID=CAMNT_0043817087 /DNA_START=163 /DNA_END=585 /DNA_ORIENTATION=-